MDRYLKQADVRAQLGVPPHLKCAPPARSTGLQSAQISTCQQQS